MSKSSNNPELFEAKTGERLNPFEAEEARRLLIESDLALGLMFGLTSRMTAPDQYHTAPAATHYGAQAVSQVVYEAQPEHDRLEMSEQARQDQAADLNAAFYDDPDMGTEEYIEAIAPEIEAQNQLTDELLRIEAARAEVARQVDANA